MHQYLVEIPLKNKKIIFYLLLLTEIYRWPLLPDRTFLNKTFKIWRQNVKNAESYVMDVPLSELVVLKHSITPQGKILEV